MVLGIRGTTTLCDALTDAVGDAAKARFIILLVAVFQDLAWLQPGAALFCRFRNAPGFLLIKQCLSEPLRQKPPGDLPCYLLACPSQASARAVLERTRSALNEALKENPGAEFSLAQPMPPLCQLARLQPCHHRAQSWSRHCHTLHDPSQCSLLRVITRINSQNALRVFSAAKVNPLDSRPAMKCFAFAPPPVVGPLNNPSLRATRLQNARGWLNAAGFWWSVALSICSPKHLLH